MEVKYVGPKPVISHTSIHFDSNKEDKYVYLNIALQLVEALDHDYIKNKTYDHLLDVSLSDREMLDILQKRCPNFSDLMDRTNNNVEDEIEENLQRTHENSILNDEEKEVLEKNIKLMRDYLIQRSINKKAYYCVMKLLADIVQQDHIDQITLPMKQNYVHVLHSLQGTLVKEKMPIDTKLTMFEKDKAFYVTLKVVNLLQSGHKPI
ncbi:hypothetical protein [Sulfurimonas sp. HSL-1716]|uniref:hypothetical protein n=1 Tax=Hydrocurvibacter sulfurireducens TaxID=3131937 RepID=UPI0031F83DBB